MTPISQQLNRRKSVKINKWLLTVLLSALAGCAPSHSNWENGMNLRVGTHFDSHLYKDCTRGCGDSYWSPVNKNKTFDKVVDESGGSRYYITWIRDCRYSVFVSADRLIKSWRYETSNVKGCYVF
ncbi:hypothetical protein QCBJ_00220 [Pseudomonas sp. QC2]|nr:hypothetical protein QCBJ_00220 [Pseudomonas sp. QC2]